jgi:hypothetical protein
MANTHVLLLEMLLRPAMAQPSGIRVYEDGLYRYMQGSSGWYDVWQFTAEEMHVLKQAISTANIPALETHYDPQFPVSDGVTTIWQVSVEGQPYQVSLAPGARLPALDNLYHTFSTLRKLSPERSHWRVRLSDSTHREFSVLGSVNAVEALRPLISAMFVAQAVSVGEESDFAPEDLLVKTDWIMEGKTEQTRLYGDGRYVRDVEGKPQEVKVLGLEQVHGVARSIAAIDWSAIPAQIDAT